MRKLIFFLLLNMFWSYSSKETINSFSDINKEPKLLSTDGQNASGAFFTKDNNGEDVIVWTEKLPGGFETGNIVRFAKWNPSDNDFGEPQEVKTSIGCRAHDESMNKIAFKSDGTIVSVFSKRTPTKKNRFAGALFYTQSFDGGNKWTKANYLHVGDTTHGLSRSFFDLERLPDGEIGAVWLDSRLTKERGDGSTLFFAKTKGKNGFIEDKPVGTSTCECCRTDLFVSTNGNIYAVYRDIWQDSIRDMSIVTSTDNGNSFSNPKRLSPDNWVINGCPHTGPSMSETKNELHCTWFTMGGGHGIYHATSYDNGNSFNQKNLLTEKGKHPQLITMESEQMVFVWDESSSASSIKHSSHSADNSSELANENGTSSSYIKAQVWKDGSPIREHWVSHTSEYAEFPVVADLGSDKMVVVWVQNIGEDGHGIFFRIMKI